MAKAYVGSNDVSKVYLGDELVWGNLLYDAEIEYMQGDGVSYIDTGIICSNDSKVELKAKNNNNTIANGMFGSRIYVDKLLRCFYLYSLNTSQVQFGFNNTGENVNTKTSDEHTYIIEKNGCYIDGVKVLDVSNAPFVCPSSVLLFSCHTGSNGLNVESRMMTGRINYCKIWNSNVLVRDLIPVRVGTTGYMYDKVSGQLFGNAGTGSFILGPDVN